MGRKKAERHKENTQNPKIVQKGHIQYKKIAGKWSESFFGNRNNISLEIACGRGEYTVGLAEIFPHYNYIGMDLKGERIRHGAQRAYHENLTNVGFIRDNVFSIKDFFGKNEIQRIWIIHPDPRPKNRDTKRRLTHPRFLEMYTHILGPQGCLHFKTDDIGLWKYTLETLIHYQRKIHGCTHDLYKSPLYAHHFGIHTHYEKRFYAQGNTSKYLYASPPTQCSNSLSCPLPIPYGN